MVQRKRREFHENKREPLDSTLLKKVMIWVLAGFTAAVVVIYFIGPLFKSDPVIQEEQEVIAPPPQAKLRVLNGCGVSGLGDQLKTFLDTNGFEVYETDNADNFRYQYTTIIEKDSAGSFGKAVSNLMGVLNITYNYTTQDTLNVEIIIGRDYKNFKPFKQ